MATGDAEKKSSIQGNRDLKAHTRRLKVQHKIDDNMKTFTYKQAIEALNKYFAGYRIIKVWDTVKALNIIFRDSQGKKWELISTSDIYFQTVENYIIIEA